MPSLREAFRGHPVYVHHPNFDFESVREVPDSHAWPLVEGYQLDKIDQSLQGDESVPVIDLAAPDVVARLGHACEKWGVFQVINHGVTTRLLDRVESQGRRLFSLPAKQKLKAARAPDGVTGYGVARISSFFSKLLWSEGFTIVGSPVEHARQLWPHDYSHFCDVMEEYQKEMNQLAGRLMWLILESLGLSQEDVTWAGPAGDFPGTTAGLQLNSYPACPNPDRAMGLAEHTDSPLLTLLYQSSTSGLQVLSGKSGKWITVPPLPGALVINVGDLLHVLSNGRYRSALHRAVANRTSHRLSVAYLWGPPPNVQLGPFSKLVGPGCNPMYRQVTWPEYLSIKAMHFNKALSLIRHPMKPISRYCAINTKEQGSRQDMIP